MSQEYAGFSTQPSFSLTNAQSNTSGLTRSSHGPRVLANNHRLYLVGPPAPERDTPTPEQQLAAVIEFIDTTTRLSAQQLHWLAFMERWIEPSKHYALDKQIEATIQANELALVDVVSQLAQQGKPIKIGHPQTGQSVPVIGLRYSNEQLAYQVAIPEPAPTPPTLVPLFSSGLLHL